MRPFISPNRHNRVFRLLTRPILTVLAVVSLGWSVFLDLEGSTKWALTAAGCLTIVMTLLSLDRSDKLTDRKVRKRSAQTLRWDLGPRTAPGLGLPVLTGVEEARDIVRLVGANASDCARILSNLGHETYELGWLVLVDDDTDGSTHATSHPLLEQWTREKLNRTERSGDFKYHRVVIIKDADRLPEGRIEAWQAWVGDSIRNHVVIAEPLRSPAAPDADIATASGGANGNSGGRSLTTVRTTSDTANNPAAAARDGRSLFPLVDLSMIRVSALRRDSRVMARISFRALLWVGAFVGIAVLFGAPHSRQPSQLALSSFHAFFTVLAIAWVAVRLAWPEAHHVRARTLIFESVAIYVALTFATSLSSMLQAAFLVSCFTIARLLLDPRFRPAIDLGPQSLCTAGGLVVVWFALVDADSSAMLVATLYLLCTLCRPTTRLLWFTAAAAGTYGLDLLQTDGLSHIFSTNAEYRLSVVLGLGCAILLANATALMQAQLPLPTGLFLVAGSLMIWFVVRPTAVVVTHGVTADRYLTQTLVDRNLAIFGWMVAFWVGSTVLQRLRVRSLPSLFTVGVVSVAPVALVNSEFSDLLRPELLGSVAVGGVVLSLVVFYCIRASDDRLAPLKVCLGGAAAMAGWLATSVSTIGPAVIALGFRGYWSASGWVAGETLLQYAVGAVGGLAGICFLGLLWSAWAGLGRAGARVATIRRLRFTPAQAMPVVGRLIIGVVVLLLHTGRHSGYAYVTQTITSDLHFKEWMPVSLTVRLWPLEITPSAVIWAALTLAIFEWAYRLRGLAAGIVAASLLALYPGNAMLAAISVLVLIGSPRDVLTRRQIMGSKTTIFLAVASWVLIAVGVTYQTADQSEGFAWVVVAALPTFLPALATLVFIGAKRPIGGPLSMRFDFARKLRRRALGVVTTLTAVAAILACSFFGDVSEVVAYAVIPCLIDTWLVLHVAVLGSLSPRGIRLEKAARSSVQQLRLSEYDGSINVRGAHCEVVEPIESLVA